MNAQNATSVVYTPYLACADISLLQMLLSFLQV